MSIIFSRSRLVSISGDRNSRYLMNSGAGAVSLNSYRSWAKRIWSLSFIKIFLFSTPRFNTWYSSIPSVYREIVTPDIVVVHSNHEYQSVVESRNGTNRNQRIWKNRKRFCTGGARARGDRGCCDK